MSYQEKSKILAAGIAAVESMIEDFQSRFYDIPFDNSAFQNVNFVVRQQLTPARAYRAIGLRMSAKIAALQEAFFNRKLEDVDIEELRAKIEDPDTGKWDKMRAEIEIQRKMASRPFADKLINDAIVELKTLQEELNSLPRYTREQFEAEEHEHFELRLRNQMNGITGAAESLIAMNQSNVRTSHPEELAPAQRKKSD
jgi:hypothetical protein